eukprot:185162-Pelagomonas_calceolata.AAC.1
MIDAVHIITQRASSIGGRPIKSDGMLLCVDCPYAVFDYIYLLFKSNLRSRPEGEGYIRVLAYKGVFAEAKKCACNYTSLILPAIDPTRPLDILKIIFAHDGCLP